MGAKALSERDNWQAAAKETGARGETNFEDICSSLLPKNFRYQSKPRITVFEYDGGRAIEPDGLITNLNNGKQLLTEVKTGDQGGNATEERACKFATAGLKEVLRRQLPGLVEETCLSVFGGAIVNGKDGKMKKYRNNAGQWVHPNLYREKIGVYFKGEEHVILDHDLSNASTAVNRIVELLS